MSWVATTKGIYSGLVGDLIMQAAEKRFGSNGKPSKPIEWLTDNGSCYTVAETRSFTKEVGTTVTSPQINVMVESFVKTLNGITRSWHSGQIQNCDGSTERLVR